MNALDANIDLNINLENIGVVQHLDRTTPKNGIRKQELNILTVANHLWKDIYDDSQELSITFTEKILNTYKMSYIKTELHNIFKKYDNKLLITGFMDYAPIGGRPHIHAVIKPYNDGIKYMDKFKRQIAKTFGGTRINPIHGRKSYIAYMLKVYQIRVKLTLQEIITNDYRINDNMINSVIQDDNDIQYLELNTLMMKHNMSKE